MKFVYEYRTRDNVHHEGVINAASRDAAFAALKMQGIRPGRVVEAPGFFNKLFGKGKRWIAIGVLGIALAVAIWMLCSIEGVEATEEDRSQIYGDPSILQRCVAEGWANVFDSDADRFLARFAQPGDEVTVDVPAIKSKMSKALAEAGKPVEVFQSDSEEVRKMKRIVNGMKRELAQYIADGGTPEVYIERLAERQSVEARIVSHVKSELAILERRGEKTNDRAELVARWNEHNRLLREMGMRTQPLPEDWDVGGK